MTGAISNELRQTHHHNDGSFPDLRATVSGSAYVAGFGVAVVGALVLGVLNGLLRPILVILSIPITILTLGLFLIVLNGLMLSMMTWFVPGIVFSGFGATMLLAVIISVLNMMFVGKN